MTRTRLLAGLVAAGLCTATGVGMFAGAGSATADSGPGVQYLNEFGGPGQFSSQLAGIAVEPDGNLVVADRGDDPLGADSKLQLYTTAGGLVRDLSTPAQGLRLPTATAASATGTVGEIGAQQNRTFTESGQMLTDSTCGLQNAYPAAVAIDREARVYVAGATYQNSVSTPTVTVCDTTGQRVTSFPSGGQNGVIVGGDLLAIGPDDRLYALSDKGLEVFDSAGNLLRAVPLTAPGGSSAFALGPDGRFWVGTLAGTVSTYAADGTLQATFGSYGSAPGQTKTIGGIAVESDGVTVDVLDRGNQRIERFRELASSGGSGGTGGSSGGVVGIDTTPPVVTVTSEPAAADLLGGRVPLTVSCNERCTVSITGELSLVRRETRRLSGRAARAARFRAALVIPGKPLPRQPSYHPPRALVTSRVIWSGDFSSSAGTFDANAAGTLSPAFVFADPGDPGALARRATSARLSFTITATDDAGNTTTATLEERVNL